MRTIHGGLAYVKSYTAYLLSPLLGSNYLSAGGANILPQQIKITKTKQFQFNYIKYCVVHTEKLTEDNK
jgi:hypothetical protein